MRVAVVLFAIALLGVAVAAEDKPAAKRIRRKKVPKSTTTTTTTTTEAPDSTDSIERQARFLLDLFQTTTEAPSFQRRFSGPSGAYVNDLMGLESQNEKRVHTFEYTDGAEDKIFFGNNGQQNQPFGGLFNGFNNNNNGGYGSDGQVAASGSGQSGEGASGVPNDLIQATLPVAFVGLLVLAASAVFATQVDTNSTSNQTFPLLWQLPNELQNNYPNNNNVNLGRRRRDAVQVDGEEQGAASVPALNTNVYVDRFKDGAVLYAMMEEDEGCRKKIACVFGSKVRDSPHKDMLSGVVRKLIPKRLEAFSSEFLRAAEDESLTLEECSRWTCSKCFEI